LLKDIYDIPASLYIERLNKLVETMDIGSLLKTPVRQLSLGQRMRCEVVAALLHSPKILFLDEPTIGLDAISKLALRDFLKNENRQNGVTMILTTHDMDDIEALCDRVMVIGHGRLLFDGNLEGLKKQFSPLRCIHAITETNMNKIEICGAVKTDVAGRDWTIWFDPAKTPAHKIVAEMAEKLPLVDIMIKEQDIDEMIAVMYREMDL
jgi:ABC-2 type transport system ATP-binding protein